MGKRFSKWRESNGVPPMPQGIPDLTDPTNRDSVPAMLTPGEFVVNKDAEQHQTHPTCLLYTSPSPRDS